MNKKTTIMMLSKGEQEDLNDLARYFEVSPETLFKYISTMTNSYFKNINVNDVKEDLKVLNIRGKDKN